MKLTNIFSIFPKLALCGFVMTAMTTIVACDSMIYDDEGDCSVHYRVGFRYTRNILNADAFGSQVTEVNFYLFRQDGSLAFHKKELRDVTTDNDFHIDVDVVPGTYDMIAWCGGKSLTDDPASFNIDKAENPDRIEDLRPYITLEAEEENNYFSRDIHPLFYGYRDNVEFKDTYGVVDLEPLDLMKDTNHFSVVLQNSDGTTIDPDDINMTIEGTHSELTWQNQLAGNQDFHHRPWSMTPLSADFDDKDVDTRTRADGDATYNGLRAEFTTGRLMTDVKQKLTVKNNKSGETIFSIPLVDYVLLVRDMYKKAHSDQDYLDRCDDYSLVFFVNKNLDWNKARVIINGWRVVPPQSGIL